MVSLISVCHVVMQWISHENFVYLPTADDSSLMERKFARDNDFPLYSNLPVKLKRRNLICRKAIRNCAKNSYIWHKSKNILRKEMLVSLMQRMGKLSSMCCFSR